MNRIAFGFEYLIELFDPHGRLVIVERVHNLVPTEGLSHIASTVFKGGAQVPTWYIGLFEGNYTPQASATGATIAAAATECITYSAGARVEFVEGAVASGSVDNSASKAEFTFTADKVVYGGFICSASPKGSTTGVLASVVRFPSPKTCETGSVLRVTAGVAFTSV